MTFLLSSLLLIYTTRLLNSYSYFRVLYIFNITFKARWGSFDNYLMQYVHLSSRSKHHRLFVLIGAGYSDPLHIILSLELS